MAVNSFMQNAKCPIVLISRGERKGQSLGNSSVLLRTVLLM